MRPLRMCALLAAYGVVRMAPAQQYNTWRDYGGSADSAQYSGLSQINRSNVSRLKVAWTYPIGDDNHYSFNPIVVDERMYVLAKNRAIVALDAASGREIWTHPAEPGTTIITDRGINYWESRDRSDRRLLYASNHFLRALDARTGQTIRSFGKDGAVDLKQGLDRDPATIRLVQSTTPGRVFENLLILGSATNQGYGSAPGDIRAFDVRTGALVWTFHTIPRPGEFGYDTWPKDAWKRVGGANVWGELSLDEKRAIVYAPTASAKYNFYGADRRGADLFADCLLALDARTGKRLWHFQTVHHDIWDYDDATAPKLVTVRHQGRTVDAVAQVTKQGFVWVFDRVTGEPLWPSEERPVPRSDLPDEETWPTQPFPSKPPPFARQKFTVDDLSPYLTAEDRARFRDEILSARNDGLYTPPSRRGTIEMPGNNGGANWGGAAADPAHGDLFVVSKDLPSLLRLTSGAEADQDRYYSGFGFMIAGDGLSAIAPPWSSLTAYDLNAGTIRWRVPLGEVKELAAKGIRNTGSHFPKVGPVVTAGGLIFAGTRDGKARALDRATGAQLWEYQLDAALEGMPAVYQVGGRQYVVFCAAAQSGLTPGTQVKIRGTYVAFALN
ncbi:MAG: pyrroloquinoline quinone-dependent dehydrogenase [Bryobacteraceae bacterium]